jgi:NADPH2:quinone reductase
MVDAIQFRTPGKAEVLRMTKIELPALASDEVQLRHTAIGINFIDIYHRSGVYPVKLPAIPGMEAAGVVEAVGSNVTSVKVGDRVAYGRGPMGAYATGRNIGAKELIAIPEGVTDETAASAMLKGLTAWYLLHQAFPVSKGDTVLIHAAAGGVGLILSQWAKKLGCRVIGTVGSPDKAIHAKAHGCDEVILYRSEDVAARVLEFTGGAGVTVVYDAVGKTTFTASLDSLKPQGMLVSYGQASGPVPPFDIAELSKRGSLYLTRPNLKDYLKDDAIYQRAGKALLAMIAAGDIKISTAQRYPLSEAAAAHRALEVRQTTGSTILIP